MNATSLLSSLDNLEQWFFRPERFSKVRDQGYIKILERAKGSVDWLGRRVVILEDQQIFLANLYPLFQILFGTPGVRPTYSFQGYNREDWELKLTLMGRLFVLEKETREAQCRRESSLLYRLFKLPLLLLLKCFYKDASHLLYSQKEINSFNWAFRDAIRSSETAGFFQPSPEFKQLVWNI